MNRHHHESILSVRAKESGFLLVLSQALISHVSAFFEESISAAHFQAWHFLMLIGDKVFPVPQGFRFGRFA